MNQEVGHVDALERLRQPRAADGVAFEHLHVSLHARRVARERAQIVAVTGEPRDQMRADKPASTADQDSHCRQ